MKKKRKKNPGFGSGIGVLEGGVLVFLSSEDFRVCFVCFGFHCSHSYKGI